MLIDLIIGISLGVAVCVALALFITIGVDGWD